MFIDVNSQLHELSMSLSDDMTTVIISIITGTIVCTLQDCESDALVVRKSEGADGGPLCTLNFPHSLGAVVTSEGARHTLASM